VTDRRKSFGSDNHAGAHPDVLAALSAANDGDAISYGDDQVTRQAAARLCEVSGATVAYFVFNGTGANVLGLSLMLRPFQAVICSEYSHLHEDECGAAERILGSKLLTVATGDGKLTPELIATQLAGRGDEHKVQPRAVAIAQVTELGTCYSLDELATVARFCQEQDLLLFIDGARLANAAAYLGCTIADIAAHADVLTFGGTKNGAVGAEAVLVMNPALAAEAPFQRKQLMQLASKMRFVAVQFCALLHDDLWLRNARHANTMAARLAAAVTGLSGVEVAQPVQGNAVFAVVASAVAAKLQETSNFSVWELHAERSLVRWMAAFDTGPEDVDTFASDIAELTGSGPAAPWRFT
jgi:threonine aldolase